MQFRLQNENICSKTFQLPSQLSKQKRSTLQSTKTSENFESGTNGKGASWESLFRKSESCQISEKRTIQPKLPEIPEEKSNQMEIYLLEISEKIGIFVYLAR